MFWTTCSNPSTRRDQRRSGKDRTRAISFAGGLPRRFLAAALLVLSAASIAPAIATPRAGAPAAIARQPAGIFGSLEFATNSRMGIGEWRRVQTEVKLEQGLYAACDAGRSECPSYLRRWRDALKALRGAGEATQLERVNDYVNRSIRYTSDRSAFRSADFWASPLQALKGRGDCEDYAIAKYESLKALGFSESRLRIVVVNDTRKNIGHAVLSVAMPDGAYVLDNQNPAPVPSRRIAYYAPVYSINATGRWINIATRQVTPVLPAGQVRTAVAAPAATPGIQPATGDLKRILRPTIAAGGADVVFTAGNRFAFPFGPDSD